MDGKPVKSGQAVSRGVALRDMEVMPVNRNVRNQRRAEQSGPDNTHERRVINEDASRPAILQNTHGWDAVYGEGAMFVPDLVECDVVVGGVDTVMSDESQPLHAVGRLNRRLAMRGSLEAPHTILHSAADAHAAYCAAAKEVVGDFFHDGEQR